FSNLVDEASQDSIQHSLYDKRSEKVCESRHSPGVNVQHCNTGEKSQCQIERNQRTSDEGETSKPQSPQRTKMQLVWKKKKMSMKRHKILVY
ncbi:Hypothetical predicted protein, partial [Paramuricea clavata]